jgi:hypothetical protein
VAYPQEHGGGLLPLSDRLQAASAHCLARVEVAQWRGRPSGYWTFTCCLPRAHRGPHRHEEVLLGGRLEHWALWDARPAEVA